MLPTIGPNDMTIANPLYYSSNAVSRFDIVVFQAPEWVTKKYRLPEGTRYLSRVIGLPGEKIEIKNGLTFINNELIIEPFERIKDDERSESEVKDFQAMIIPDGEYFIMGDNRANSLDSRYWKPSTIKKSAIYSKIVQIKKDYYR